MLYAPTINRRVFSASPGGIGQGINSNTGFLVNLVPVVDPTGSTRQAIYGAQAITGVASSPSVGCNGVVGDILGCYAATTRTLSGTLTGVRSYAYLSTASHEGTISLLNGFFAQVGIVTGHASGVLTAVNGLHVELRLNGAGTITTYKALNLTENGSTSTVTTKYGLYDGMSGAIHYLAGNLRIGVNSGGSQLRVRGTGTSSAANAGLFEDSAGTALLTLRNDGGWALKGGTVGLAQTGYTTFANLTTVRTLDANATTVEELADVVGTMIEDFKTKGLIAA